MEELVILAIPIFTVLMLIEFVYGMVRGRNTYTLTDTLSNLSQGLLSRLSQFVNQFFHLGIYALLYHWIWKDYENPFWATGFGIAVGMVVFDFCDYWFHRTEHESAVFWAAHVIHHQSKHYNLSVALRQVSTEPLLGFIFYLPLALLGMPPVQLALTVLIILFYQFWVHTEHIGKLGWFDLVFQSPSNHRVHHAINPQYLDKNYGVFLMVWDHLFGTYEPEVEPCVYGTKKPFDSVDPVWTIVCEYVSILNNVKNTKGFANKLRCVFKAPGWTAVQDFKGQSAASYRAETSAIGAYQPIWNSARVAISLVQFFSVVVFSILFLINEDTAAYFDGVLIIGTIVILCWGLGAFMMRKINFTQLLMIDALCAVLLYLKLIVNFV